MSVLVSVGVDVRRSPCPTPQTPRRTPRAAHFFAGALELECSFTLSLGMPRPSSIDLRPMNAEKSCRESADGARCSSFKYPGSSTSGLAVLCRCKKSNEDRLLVVLGMFRESSSVSCVHRVRRFEGIEGWGVLTQLA